MLLRRRPRSLKSAVCKPTRIRSSHADNEQKAALRGGWLYCTRVKTKSLKRRNLDEFPETDGASLVTVLVVIPAWHSQPAAFAAGANLR